MLLVARNLTPIRLAGQKVMDVMPLDVHMHIRRILYYPLILILCNFPGTVFRVMYIVSDSFHVADWQLCLSAGVTFGEGLLVSIVYASTQQVRRCWMDWCLNTHDVGVTNDLPSGRLRRSMRDNKVAPHDIWDHLPAEDASSVKDDEVLRATRVGDLETSGD